MVVLDKCRRIVIRMKLGVFLKVVGERVNCLYYLRKMLIVFKVLEVIY